jgi:predicted nucleic acid-binding Zn finger protein
VANRHLRCSTNALLENVEEVMSYLCTVLAKLKATKLSLSHHGLDELTSASPQIVVENNSKGVSIQQRIKANS